VRFGEDVAGVHVASVHYYLTCLCYQTSTRTPSSFFRFSRDQGVRFGEDVAGVLRAWASLIDACNLVFIHAPKRQHSLFHAAPDAAVGSECSCDVHLSSVHPAHGNRTVNTQLYTLYQ
jgi:hypothetical protein